MSARRTAAWSIALGVLALSADVTAYCRTRTTRADVVGDCSEVGAFLGWSNVCVSYSLHVSGTPDPERLPVDGANGWREVTRASVARWRQAGCDQDGRTQPYLQLMPLGDTATPSGVNRSGPNANSISFNTVWRRDSLHDPQAVAITVVTFDVVTGQIFDADMEMNAAFNEFATDPMDTERMDLETVLTHEFGHFQGLAHNHENPLTVMYPSVLPGEQRRQLTSDDTAGICAIYPPAEAPASLCNPVPSGGFALTPNGGRVVGGCAVGDPGQNASGRLMGVWLIAAVLVLFRRGSNHKRRV